MSRGGDNLPLDVDIYVDQELAKIRENFQEHALKDEKRFTSLETKMDLLSKLGYLTLLSVFGGVISILVALVLK